MTAPVIWLGYNLSFLIEIYFSFSSFCFSYSKTIFFFFFWCVLYTLGFCQVLTSFRRLLTTTKQNQRRPSKNWQAEHYPNLAFEVGPIIVRIGDFLFDFENG
jgi:hypothetical protein